MGSPGFAKRQKEKQRQDKQRDKADRAAERKREKAAKGPNESGEDPDLAGIVPGPQPVIEE